jgi:hypothetical protein
MFGKTINKDNGNGSMNDNENLKKKARIAGLLYLSVIVFGVFAQLIRMNLIVAGDAAATAENIMDNEFLYRISFASDILMITSFILLPFAFYKIFGKLNKNLATLVVVFVLVSVPVMLVNMLLHLAPLVLLNGGEHLSTFSTDQLNSVVMILLDLREIGVVIATIFHGAWLLPLGIMVYRSSNFPKVFGILLVLACIGFLLETFVFFMLPSGMADIAIPGYILEIIGEFGFCGYLLIKGARIIKPSSREA